MKAGLLDYFRSVLLPQPVRVLLLSIAALAIPIAGVFLVPEQQEDYQALLWLVALIPAFLLAYHRGWRGIATSLAAGMAALSVTYAVAESTGRHVPELLFPVVFLYIVITLTVGWLIERVRREAQPGSLEGAAYLDSLTGLPGRRHAELHLALEFGSAQRGRALAVVLLDLDQFRAYSLRHGPLAADDVLRCLGSALRATTRRSNVSARSGHDEFICVLAGCDDEGALGFMTRLQRVLADRAVDLKLPSLSAGIATYRPAMRHSGDLVAAAEEALKRAKRDGPGRVRVAGRPTSAPMPGLPEGLKPAAGPERPVVVPGSSRRALIVVEEEPIRLLLARYLADHGFKVVLASNLVDGLQYLNVESDLLVADISMREGLGAELVRAAKLRWPSIQVMGVMDAGAGSVSLDALNAGVDRFIDRPLDLPQLRQHLGELLSTRDRLITSVLENRQQSLEYQAEKAEAEAALQRSEEEYRVVVESLQEVIFRIDTAGAFTFLNGAWSAITGHGVESSLHEPIHGFVHADDRSQLCALLGMLLEGDLDEGHVELRLRARDGTLRWVGLRARRTAERSAGGAAVTGTLYDLTRSKAAEEQLRRSEAASRALLEALPDQVFALNRSGTFVSHSGTNSGGESPVGRALEDLFPAGIAQAYRQAVQRVFATRSLQICEYQLETPAGTRQYEARLALAGDDEAVAIVRNVSDRKRLEEQVRKGQKLEAIGRLAGGLAHDFNNLLTVVQGNAHLLMEEYGGNADAQDFAQQIDAAAERGAELVRQLLAFGRRQVLQPRVLNLNGIIDGVDALLPRLIGEDILIELDLDPTLGLVRADPGQIEQVIVNLAAFAKSRMPEGGNVRISTSNANAPRDFDPHLANLHGPLVRLTLEDCGPPLEPEIREHAFEPFYGAIGSTPGGLGLATVYGIVTQSGGAILLDDAPHSGARFQVFLPRVEQH